MPRIVPIARPAIGGAMRLAISISIAPAPKNIASRAVNQSFDNMLRVETQSGPRVAYCSMANLHFMPLIQQRIAAKRGPSHARRLIRTVLITTLGAPGGYSAHGRGTIRRDARRRGDRPAPSTGPANPVSGSLWFSARGRSGIPGPGRRDPRLVARGLARPGPGGRARRPLDPLGHVFDIRHGRLQLQRALLGVPGELVHRECDPVAADPEHAARVDDEPVDLLRLRVHQHGRDAADLLVVIAVDAGPVDVGDILLG